MQMHPIALDWLRWRARATPHKLAILFEGRSVRYAELDSLADRIAGALVARRIQPGDRVAASVGNSVEAIALIHAVARVQAVLAPLNTRLTTAERSRQHALAGPALLVADGDESHSAGDQANDAPSPAGHPAQGPVSGETESVTLDELCSGALMTDRADPGLSDAAPLANSPPIQSIIFTSGTTGTPKGVALSLDNHFWSATASAYRLGLNAGERWLSCLPLYHVGGLAVVFRSCLYGTAIVLHPGFDIGAFQRSLREDGVTLTSLVPTMLHRLLNSDTATVWPDSLRLILLGGAAAQPDLLLAAQEAGVPVATTYGLTETASQVATALPADVHSKPGSVGKPLMFSQARIADRDGQKVPTGKIGEIHIRGPQVMSAYYADPEATQISLRGGWLHTGDMGFLDMDNDLFVVQRRRDIIVSGGENIYPAEVEAALRAHPDVADACVVGLVDAEWGQRCAAAVQLRRGANLTGEALLAFSRKRLAGYKQPASQYIRFVKTLPQTSSGKIARRAVEELLSEFNSTSKESPL